MPPVILRALSAARLSVALSAFLFVFPASTNRNTERAGEGVVEEAAASSTPADAVEEAAAPSTPAGEGVVEEAAASSTPAASTPACIPAPSAPPLGGILLEELDRVDEAIPLDGPGEVSAAAADLLERLSSAGERCEKVTPQCVEDNTEEQDAAQYHHSAENADTQHLPGAGRALAVLLAAEQDAGSPSPHNSGDGGAGSSSGAGAATPAGSTPTTKSPTATTAPWKYYLAPIAGGVATTLQLVINSKTAEILDNAPVASIINTLGAITTLCGVGGGLVCQKRLSGAQVSASAPPVVLHDRRGGGAGPPPARLVQEEDSADDRQGDRRDTPVTRGVTPGACRTNTNWCRVARLAPLTGPLLFTIHGMGAYCGTKLGALRFFLVHAGGKVVLSGLIDHFALGHRCNKLKVFGTLVRGGGMVIVGEFVVVVFEHNTVFEHTQVVCPRRCPAGSHAVSVMESIVIWIAYRESLLCAARHELYYDGIFPVFEHYGGTVPVHGTVAAGGWNCSRLRARQVGETTLLERQLLSDSNCRSRRVVAC